MRNEHARDKWAVSVCLAVASVLLLAGSAAAGTIYVDDDAPLLGNGLTWPTAYKYLQDALAVAVADDEIHVAQGIYKPDQDEAGNVTPGERAETFQLINGVAIHGGYAGIGAPDPDARDVDLYETILSGDLIGDDGPDFANNDENSYHVVTGSGTDETAVLDGVTVTAGNANESFPNNRGPGMYNHYGDPTLTNCTFTGNLAAGEYSGGGMHNCYSNPRLTNCTFSGNSAGWAGGGMLNDASSPTLTNCTFSGNSATGKYGFGGGMRNQYSSPTLIDCTFSGNSATGQYGCGGGMDNAYSSPTLTNCIFDGNSAPDGGGMYNKNTGSPTLTNCTFSGNSAAYYGGGMHSDRSDPTLTNCTFSGNSGGIGGGMWNGVCSPTLTNCTFSGNSATAYYGSGGGMSNASATVTLTNCIVWGNRDRAGTGESAQIYYDSNSSCAVTYSCIEDWSGRGEGNIIADPMFADPDGPDDDPDTWQDNDYHLLAESPCINRGDPSGDYTGQVDMDDDPRVVHGRVDIGADEFTGTLLPARPALAGTEPAPNHSLGKTLNNVVLLFFDMPITLPGGDALSIIKLADSSDVSSSFTYSLEPDGVTLRATEDGDVLDHQNSYRLSPDASFDVHLFAVDLGVLYGDISNDGSVNIFDLLIMANAWNTCVGDPNYDAAADLNDDGCVNIFDLLIMAAHWDETI